MAVFPGRRLSPIGDEGRNSLRFAIPVHVLARGILGADPGTRVTVG